MRLRLICIVAVLATLVICLPMRPASAQSTGQVSVNFSAINRTTLSAEGELVFTGTITSLDDEPLTNISVRLWRDATPLTSLQSAQRAQNGGAASLAENATQNLGDLAPHDSAVFSVSASLDPNSDQEPLWLNQPGAAYWVGVEVYANTEFSQPVRVGFAPLLMAYPSQDQNAQSSYIVNFTAQPYSLPLTDLDDTPQVDIAGLSQEINGRLKALMDIAEQPGVAILIDPGLYDEIKIAAESDAEAAALAKRLDNRIKQPLAYRNSYGNIDLVQASQLADTKAAQAASELITDHPLASLQELSYTDHGFTGVNLQSFGVAALLASNIEAAGPMVLDGEQPVIATIDDQLVQSRIARQMLAGNDGVPSVILVDDAIQMAERPSWVDTTSFDEILNRPVDGSAFWQSVQSSYDQIDTSELETSLSQLSSWASLTGADDEQLAQASNKLVTGFWNQEQTNSQRKDWLSNVLADSAVMQNPNAVTLRVTNSVITSDSTVLPVTVVNNLSQPIYVQLHFASANPQRMTIDSSDVLFIEPGESATARVHPRPKANGPVQMTASITAPDATPIGGTAVFDVSANNVGDVGWIIIVVAGAVLLLATAFRVRQVRKRGRAPLLPRSVNIEK